jgi:AraC-like DNA-binding protein/ligand-binding sensor protein
MSINIATKKILQDYHSALYNLTGMATDFVAKNGEIMTLCPPEHYNPLCRMIIGTACGAAACHKDDMKIMQESMVTKENVIYECHAGLIDIAVPLFVNKKFLGMLTSGQVLKKKPTEKSFRELKKKLGSLNFDEAKLREYYFKTAVLSAKQVEAMMELISLMGNYIVESENKLLFLEAANEKNKILAARKYIEQNYQRDITISDIAGAVYLSESYFSHQFKNEVGVSAVQYLNCYRIEKAKELLRTRTLNITEIATKTGFQSLPHFNRIFRKFEKMAPRDFRKKQKK